MTYGTDLTAVHTTPGSGHWSAPPLPVKNYTEWLRKQYANNHEVNQYMTVLARLIVRHDLPPTCSGPYADDARAAIEAIAASIAAKEAGLRCRPGMQGLPRGR